MSFLTAQRWPYLMLLLSGGLLCGAWYFQYIVGLAPCQMCYWQRHAHKAVLVAATFAAVFNFTGPKRPRLYAAIIGLALMVSFALAFWHVGVEYKWWEGPKSCMAEAPALGDFDPEAFLNSLNEPMKLPACSEVPWQFLGLSMAAWNALISGLGSIASFIVAGRKTHV